MYGMKGSPGPHRRNRSDGALFPVRDWFSNDPAIQKIRNKADFSFAFRMPVV
jgi:hypothetical protein